MDTATAYLLNDLNARFYAAKARSFSETRRDAWPGWNLLPAHALAARTVLDIACGNLRFERFVNNRVPLDGRVFHCIDSCPDLVGPATDVSFQQLDVVHALIDGPIAPHTISCGQCDLVVSFGFFHHVPGFEPRRRLLELMVEMTAKGGYLAASFWNFTADKRLARKAVEATSSFLSGRSLLLDEGDYLLGWQDDPNAFRYCHDFDEHEVDALVATLGGSVKLVSRFRSDGPGGNLNSYLVMKRL